MLRYHIYGSIYEEKQSIINFDFVRKCPPYIIYRVPRLLKLVLRPSSLGTRLVLSRSQTSRLSSAPASFIQESE